MHVDAPDALDSNAEWSCAAVGSGFVVRRRVELANGQKVTIDQNFGLDDDGTSIKAYGAQPTSSSSSAAAGLTSIGKQSGDNQSATVGTAVTVKVRALNSLGVGLQGITILWTARDGSIAASSITDANGDATGLWTLDTQAGAQVLEASTAGLATLLSFSATATADVAADIQIISGNGQSGAVNTALGSPFVVRAIDQFGNPVSGETVTGAVAGGGGSLDDSSVDTDADGLASFVGTLGGAAGTNTFTATLDDVADDPSVTFTADAVASVPTQLAISGGGTQSPVAGAATTTITFRVRDAANQAVPGVLVAFGDIIGGGTLASPSNGGVSDVNGLVTITLTTHTTVQLNSFVGSILGGTVRATFSCTTVPGTSTKWAVRTQPVSNVDNGQVFSQQPVFELQDANDNAVAQSGVTGTIALTSAQTGTLNGTKVIVSDANGRVTATNLSITDSAPPTDFTLTITGGSKTAAVTSTISIAPPIASKLGQGTAPSAGVSGQVLPAFTILVQDAGGTTVPNSTAQITLVLENNPGGGSLSGTLVVNAVGGVATFDAVILTGAAVSGYTLRATTPNLTPVVTGSFALNDVTAVYTISNKPSHLIVRSDTPWDVEPGQGSGNADQYGWFIGGGSPATGATRLQILTSGAIAASAPSGNGKVLEGKFPSGMGGGGSPWVLKRTLPSGVTEFYLKHVFRCDDFTDNGNVGTKWGFCTFSTASGGGNFYYNWTNVAINLTNTGADNICGNSASGNRDMKSNYLMTSASHWGVWHCMELYVKMNTVTGGIANCDGIGQMWMDNALILNNANVAYHAPATTIPSVTIEHTYGGGTNPVPRDLFIYYDRTVLATN